MTQLINARDLWWKEPEVCTCPPLRPGDEIMVCPHDAGGWPKPLYSFDIDGALWITDRYTLLPASMLGGLPVGYGSLLTPIGQQAQDGLINWTNATALPEPSDRVFDRVRLDLIEAAGYLVRPLEGVKEPHGICEPSLRVAGLTAPIARSNEAEAGATARVVTR